ncbi:MAG: glycosyl hydrolase family 8 [Candidatus Peribacteraceae bacterium]|jgi:endoglucanase
MQSPSRGRWPSIDDAFLGAATLASTSVILVLVYVSRLTTSLIDENAHLNFSRLLSDSRTPGISQIGFWPPLLHLLLAPFTALGPLYTSGLAGAVVLVPLLFLAAVFLHRTCFLLTGKRAWSMAAASLFLLNPFVLYYAVVPMMEVLFLATTFGTAYAITYWLKERTTFSLIFTGAMVSLSCLARYEGLILLPVTGAVILFTLLRERAPYARLEAVSLIFGIVAVLGFLFIAVYGWIFGGSPLAFMGGSWLRDPSFNVRPAHLNLIASLRYTLHAAYHMGGQFFVLLSLVSFLWGTALSLRYREALAPLLVLLSPLLFVVITQFTGSTIINVPELPPYGFFNNDRYGLTVIGFVVLAPLLLLHTLRYGKDNRFSSLLTGVRSVALIALFALSGAQFQRVVFAERFDTIRRDINSPSREQRETARFLREHYRGGNILMSRSDNDPIITETGIPLDRYIYEGNYLYFEQALREPWNFAQWIVMHNPASAADPWAEQNEQVYQSWGADGALPAFFEPAFENNGRKVYRLNEEAFRAFVQESGFNAQAIPSLDGENDWDPRTIYTAMRMPRESAVPLQAALSKDSIPPHLKALYESHLKPAYRNGFYTDVQGTGTSESQSYALWQSFLMDDRETFDRVWRWTKLNLQRPDRLFQWKFAMQGEILVVLDANSATDADTDIAYLLLRAGEEWGGDEYLADALPIINGIWENETATTQKGRHLTAGNWATTGSDITLNPSYFSPHAYRLFSAYDTQHDWEEVVAQGYEDLKAVSARPMGTLMHAFLPPDWIAIDRRTGDFLPYGGKENGADYSYDAFRTFFRIALDGLLTEDDRPRVYLRQATTFERDWPLRGSPCSVYPASGTGCLLDTGSLAGPLSVWSITHPRRAEDVVRTFYLEKGSPYLSPAAAFYEKSWYWFGLWLWSNAPDA